MRFVFERGGARSDSRLTRTAGRRSLRTHRGQLVKPSTKGKSVKSIHRSLLVLLCLVLVSLCRAEITHAQPTYHVVQPGDTLWDICEHYYGDSELWPKLWEMNPFVTNPHLLKPGDKVRLLEGYPLERRPPLSQGRRHQRKNDLRNREVHRASRFRVSAMWLRRVIFPQRLWRPSGE